MIDKVYYINLDREVGRHYAQRVTAAMAYLPLEKLHRFPAKDGSEYESNEDIIEDIIADGFPEYRWFLENPERQWRRPKNYACNWSHLSVLREVVNNKENAIILEDDAFVKTSYPDIEKDFRSLDQPFEIVWLHARRWHAWPLISERHFKLEIEFERELLPTNVEGLYLNYYGLGAHARYFTAKGAEKFLDLLLSNVKHGSELVCPYTSVGNKNREERRRWLVYRPNDKYVVFNNRIPRQLFSPP